MARPRSRLLSEARLAEIRNRIVSLLTIEPRDFSFSDLVQRICGAGVCTEHYLGTELKRLVEDGKVDTQRVRKNGQRVLFYRAHRYDGDFSLPGDQP